MSEFYTNVFQHKNYILVKGYKNGNKVEKKIKFKPYFFVPTKKESKYKTLFGENVDRIDFDTIYDARNFIKKYNDVDSFKIYGYSHYLYNYLYDSYSNIKYNTNDISIVTIDIETVSMTVFQILKQQIKK